MSQFKFLAGHQDDLQARIIGYRLENHLKEVNKAEFKPASFDVLMTHIQYICSEFEDCRKSFDDLYKESPAMIREVSAALAIMWRRMNISSAKNVLLTIALMCDLREDTQAAIIEIVNAFD